MLEDKTGLLHMAALAHLFMGVLRSGIGAGQHRAMDRCYIGLPEDLRLPFSPACRNPAATAPERTALHHPQLPGYIHHRQQMAGQENTRGMRLLKMIRGVGMNQHQQGFQRLLLGRAAGHIANQAVVDIGQVKARVIVTEGNGGAQVHKREEIVLQVALRIARQDYALECGVGMIQAFDRKAGWGQHVAV